MGTDCPKKVDDRNDFERAIDELMDSVGIDDIILSRDDGQWRCDIARDDEDNIVGYANTPEWAFRNALNELAAEAESLPAKAARIAKKYDF
jgi:hypothetical protein